MKSKKIILYLIVGIFLIINIDKVCGVCYEVNVDQAGTTKSYTREIPSTHYGYKEVDDSKCGVCYKVKTDQAGTTIIYTKEIPSTHYGYEKVDNSKCDQSSSSSDQSSSSAIISSNDCTKLTTKETCIGNSKKSCVWNEEYGFCNVDDLTYVQCGDAFDIPSKLPNITSFIINFFKIITPVILIIISIISMTKALMASKEDEIKKATSGLKTKLIAAAFVFFIINIVQFVINKAADESEKGSISACLDCFINNSCEKNIYLINNIDGEYVCYFIYNGKLEQRDCPESTIKLSEDNE